MTWSSRWWSTPAAREKEHNKNFRFTITTNGMLLTDDKIDYINKEMYNVVLSLDGRKEVNDRMRFRVDGSGSYDIILPKFQKLVEKRGDMSSTMSAAPSPNTTWISPTTSCIWSNMGFEQISMEPVVTDSNAALRADRRRICREVFAGVRTAGQGASSTKRKTRRRSSTSSTS